MLHPVVLADLLDDEVAAAAERLGIVPPALFMTAGLCGALSCLRGILSAG
jgi:hypothetical protein